MLAGVAGVRRCCHCRGDGGRTRAHGRRHGVRVAVLRLLTSGRFTDRPDEPQTRTSGLPDRGRRLSLLTLGFLAAGALTGVGGVVLSRVRTSVAGDREAFTLPAVDVGAPPVPPTLQPKGVALPSFITSNDDFYRIDTALSVPQLVAPIGS